MRLAGVLLALSFLLLAGCPSKQCNESQPYEETEHYNETVPLVKCLNVTHLFNKTDYSCTNYTVKEPYNESMCDEKQMKYTAYSMIDGKVCDATYTPDVNWDPVCIRSHYECAFRVANVDFTAGVFSFGMSAKFSNGSTADLGVITKELASRESYLFNWSVKLDSYEDRATCIQRIVSIPNKTECRNVEKFRNATKQDCEPISRIENITTTECSVTEDVRTIEQSRVVVKYRNVSKPC